jgi:hypothetical protein
MFKIVQFLVLEFLNYKASGIQTASNHVGILIRCMFNHYILVLQANDG